MTEILVVNEKHGDRYFIIDERSTYARVAAKLITERANEGWFSSVEELEVEKARSLKRKLKDIDESFLALTEEELAALPTALQESARKAHEAKRQALIKNERAYADELEFARGVETLLASADPGAEQFTTSRGRTDYLAIVLLNLRQDHEYEGFTTERAETA